MSSRTCCVIGTLLLGQIAAAQMSPPATRLDGAGNWGANAGYDYYVYSVATTADGGTVVVGGVGEGSARVYTRAGGTWTRQPDIPVGTDVTGSLFVAAISADGSTAAVGDPTRKGEEGGIRIFTRGGDGWSQQGPLLLGTPSEGAAAEGAAIAISGNGSTVIVGGPLDPPGGGAWVFSREGGSWSQQGSKLSGNDAPPGAAQGSSVAISADGNTAVVGAPWASATGGAWVFTRSAGVWLQQGPLLAGTDAVGAPYLGEAVAISADGNTVIAGGPGDDSFAGAAWVFTRKGGVWSQQGPKLAGRGAVGRAGQGSSVAISADGDRVVIGGTTADPGGRAVWVFTRAGGSWAQKGDALSLAAAGGVRTDASFGAAVAISGDGATVVVGAPQDGQGGSAWVFSDAPPPLWIPVVTHDGGRNGSQWRSDLAFFPDDGNHRSNLN